MPASKSLSQLQPGESSRVLHLDCQGQARQRLMEMGLTPGVDVELVRFAPLGDPVDIKVRGYHLSIRRAEADLIAIE
jgi:Fe2+ transport system protein FeoA